MPKFSYTEFHLALPASLANAKVTKLQLPYLRNNKSQERVILVFDAYTSADLPAKKLLSGHIGKFLETIDGEARKRGAPSLFDANVFTIYLNYVTAPKQEVTTKGGDTDDTETEGKHEDTHDEFNQKRVLEFCRKLNPTKIITLGRRSFQLFSQFYAEPFYANASWTNLQGVPILLNFNDSQPLLIPLLNPNWICSYQDSRDTYLIGYFIKCWVNACLGRLQHDIELNATDIKLQVIDTVKRFDKMMTYLRRAKAVAIDTETDNLSRISNRIVIIQFAVTKKTAFVLPLYHFETPFTKKELDYISQELRDYFIENDNDVHIYCNANFDIPVIRTAFSVPFYKASLWDVQAGEFCFHPETWVVTTQGKRQLKQLLALDHDELPLVYSLNLQHQQVEAKPILLRANLGTTKLMVCIHYGMGSLRVTEDHRIWVQSQLRYLAANRVEPEDTVLVYHQGELRTVSVKSVQYVKRSTTVCELNIADNHNLFVCHGPDDHALLAHNCLEENMTELKSVTGDKHGYYSLGNLSIQYGFMGYINGKFGKEERAGIQSSSLTTPGLLEYCGYDVCIPYAIYLKQLAQAQAIKHDRYEVVVKHLVGDTIHTFSTMNVNGVLVDKKHLWWLSSSQSPIETEVMKMEQEILGTKEVKLAEEYLREELKIPKMGLFGAAKTKIFSLRKNHHKQVLFFEILKLESKNEGVNGKSIDKEFQEDNKHIPIVEAYTNLTKAQKLRNAFIKSLIKVMSTDEDAKRDGRIRPRFEYLRVITGRTSASNPNLQQIPSRGRLSKYIKRIFVARPGSVFIKIDYSAHEVRGWALISGDRALSKAFQQGIDLKNRFIQDPTADNLRVLNEDGDIHRINSAYFFGVPLAKVTADIRQSVKGVTFGLIYGRSAKSLAAQLNKSMEEVNEIIDKFFKRFPKAANWLLDVEKFARQHYFVEAITGLRRHLWPYLIPKLKEREKQWRRLSSACDRRARNCVTGDTVIATSLGHVPIRDLVGKEFTVLTADGSMQPNQGCVCRGVKDIVKVTLHDSTVIRGTPDHPVYTVNQFKYKKVPMGELLGKTVVKIDFKKLPLQPRQLLVNLFLRFSATWACARHADLHEYQKVIAVEYDGQECVYDIIAVNKYKHFVGNGVLTSNSPIQGAGSGIGYSAARLIEVLVFQRFKKKILKTNHVPIRNQNMVHDSIEFEVDIPYIIHAAELINYCMTTGVERKCKQLFGMQFPVGLAIDMDIGGSLDTVKKWDGSIQELYNILKATFEYQRDTLKHDLDVEAALTTVFTGYLSPDLKNQISQGYFAQAAQYGLN